MSLTIRAHFDGKVIVPDEPVDLPVNQALEVLLSPITPEDPTQEQRREALQRLVGRAIHGVNIPLEALRRENMYEERS
jgi:hypothetical protein